MKLLTIKSKSYMQLKYIIACPYHGNHNIILEAAIIRFAEFCMSRSKGKSVFFIKYTSLRRSQG